MKPIKKIRIAIVSSSFWKEVADNLEKNCLMTLTREGLAQDQIDIIRAPGSLEIPLIAKKLAKKGIYDAIIAFGAIHKGQTYHFELVANECARGCIEVSLRYEIPVIFEVLAVYKLKHAIDRATRTTDNRGSAAALSALNIIETLSKL